MSVLGTQLDPEYLDLLKIIDGGGYELCFFGAVPRTLKALGREFKIVDLVENTVDLRKLQIIDEDEVAYARGEGLVYLRNSDGAWIGREMDTRDVIWTFGSFQELVSKAYDLTDE